MNRPERSPRLGRRELLSLGVGAFVVAAVPFSLARRPRAWRRRLPVMGTVADLVAVHEDEHVAHEAIDEAAAALWDVEARMSRFRDASEIGRANLAAAREAVPVSAATAHVLEAALRLADSTDGRFDPCLGRAIVLWDVERRETPPPEADVRRLAGRRLHRTLDLGTSAGRPCVVFRDWDVALDLGGIAKGYAVDRAAEALRARGVSSGFVNVGGDLVALGQSEDGDAWRVGVRDPADPRRLVAEIEVRDRAVATSGDYERFFRHAGTVYHHLLDADTGAPRRTAEHSLTVVADDCMTADGLATAAFGLAPAEADRLLTRLAPSAHRAT